MKLRSMFIILAAIGGLIVGSMHYYLFPFHTAPSSACAVVHPTKGNTISGSVTFIQQQNGIHIIATLQGLTPGKHGFHIHEHGDCGCDDAVCAGDHFNPTNAPHGSPLDKNAHVGDLGNIIADEHGNARYNEINNRIALFGPHSIIGRSIIIHADPDDLQSQPTGNSGKRIGCGVIGIGK